MERNSLLLRAMRWVAILSHSEASSALRAYRYGKAIGNMDTANYAGSEAVNHFGGTTQLLREAIRVRHTVAKIYAARQTCEAEFPADLLHLVKRTQQLIKQEPAV